MTRPQIIRADTIDLQDRSAPSAKDHRRPPPQSTTSNGLLAPHQAETIREVVEDRADEECRSPRLSWANGDSGDRSQHPEDLADRVANSINRNNMQQHDALAAQNGGAVSDDGDVGAEGDEDLDDDMMDKISSSPSIEDGGYTLPPPWPRRVDSLRHSVSCCDASSSPGLSEARSSSPYLDVPEHPPLQSLSRHASKAAVDASGCHHHLPGEYTGRGEDRDGRDNHDNETDHIEMNENDERAGCDGTNWKDAYEEVEQDNLSSGFGKIIEFVERTKQPAGAPQQAMERVQRCHPDSLMIDPELDRDDDYDFTIPYDASEEEDDDDDGFPFTHDPRFVESGWDGECLQDSEDIDFEFVYALHTFIATVEGQANATKGDTMVLLDDSNSYWWLVRVVKDSSIGYLPAEHIETPTERLARLNKHRNIDLAATMLGDQAEKAKNPLKSAIRRRKKTVTFTAPTYVDYSDFDYSTDEEEGEGEVSAQQQEGQRVEQQATAQKAVIEAADDDEGAKVEPLKPRGQKQAKLATAKVREKNDVDETSEDEAHRASDEIFDGKSERTTRNGTVRNTDSFFKDETTGTKKITLTPGLLRDDNEGRGSSDSKEVRQRPSLDRLEKELVPDKVKDDKKKKEKKEKEKDKKSGSIRSFFSRKDKKKSGEDDDDSLGKRSMDDADDPRQAEQEASPEKQAALQRHPSKLQKQQARPETSPTRNAALVTTQPIQPNTVENVPPATSSLRMVEPEPLEALEKAKSPQKDEKLRPAVSKVGQPSTETKPSNVTNKAKSQIEPDGFDSSRNDVASEQTNASREPEQRLHEEKQLRPTLPGAFPDSYLSTQTSTSLQQRAEPETGNTKLAVQQRPESPAPVSPLSPLSPSTASKPPALVADTSSQEGRSSPMSSPSPEPVGTQDRTHQKQDSTTTSTSTATTSTWNDTNLRAFFDSGSEIRDLLTVVYDKTDVPPAGPEHPVVGLFREPNAKLAEITTQLDNMLGDWLARKQRLRGTV
ncbi:hypothetical protein DL764_001210 [Monosporascus ibericus]|uniref:SH3 domain-containing protein n=1 Tax=Monosporascus ibericus TaxID=155417 RepID=A0A4Q4TQC2_9PEZI|nr:hypothetical protein DL764_001210 [Monosporascus ibericus]